MNLAFRSAVLHFVCLGLFSCAQCEKGFWPDEKSPVAVSKAVTEELLSRPGFMMYETEHVKAVHYAEVCTAFGAARLAGLLNDDATIARLSERYMKVIGDSIENTANHVDANVYGILPLELYRQNGDTLFLRQGMELADRQWDHPRPDGLTDQTRFWIDDVWMIGSLQTEAYRVTGDKTYLDRAAVETVAYLDKLQRPNGLFYHGDKAPFFWGRGNGWVAAGLAEILSELPEDHPQYGTIAEGYRKMMEALLTYQAEDGMWRQLIDVESAWKETSCTGMFGYAITVGVKKGLLPEKKFRPALQKAWLALAGYINEEGKVSNVCVGTGQSPEIDYYLNRPTVTGDFHGQAPVLWFAYSLLME
jgi:unsaturated rhamnogalacturonyl hydrolase